MRLTRIRHHPESRKLTEGELQGLCTALEVTLQQIALMTSSAEVVNSSHINLHDIRLSDEHISRFGYNRSPWTGIHGRVLGWRDWVLVNNTVNDCLDLYGIEAHVYSLHGKFEIRQGMQRFSEADWTAQSYEQIGSYFNPIWRKDAWVSSDEPKCPKHPWYTGKRPARGGDDRMCIFCGRIRAGQIALEEATKQASLPISNTSGEVV